MKDNIWNKPGIPHKGWKLIDTVDSAEDGDEERTLCDMCGTSIRFVHYISHPDYPSVLGVGCICASKLTNDYDTPNANETSLKNAAAKKKRDAEKAKREAEERERKARYAAEERKRREEALTHARQEEISQKPQRWEEFKKLDWFPVTKADGDIQEGWYFLTYKGVTIKAWHKNGKVWGLVCNGLWENCHWHEGYNHGKGKAYWKWKYKDQWIVSVPVMKLVAFEMVDKITRKFA